MSTKHRAITVPSTGLPGERKTSIKMSNDDDNRLLEYSELEPWMQDNEFMQTSYRKASYSFAKSFWSAFRIHNETVNIWSHILGSLLFTGYVFHLWTSVSASAGRSLSDLLAITVYEISVVNCFGCSFILHILSNHSDAVHSNSNKLDHLGITGVLYGTGIAATYFEFYCRPSTRNTYWALSTSFAIASVVFSVRPEFRTPAYRTIRVYAHSLLGLSCFIPIVHGLFAYGYEELDHRMSVSFFGALAICQFTGGLIYGARIPERWYPRTFDVCGASHQIMHVMVVIGALIYRHGLFQAMNWWTSAGRSTCPAYLS